MPVTIASVVTVFSINDYKDRSSGLYFCSKKQYGTYTPKKDYYERFGLQCLAPLF